MTDFDKAMANLGLVREGALRDGEVWDSDRPCACGSRLTFDDGTGFTCVECGRWKAGGSGFLRLSTQEEGEK